MSVSGPPPVVPGAALGPLFAPRGIVVIGAMLIAAGSHTWLGYVLAFVAMVFGAMNVVGGYVVTDRMLEMFKARPTAGTPDKVTAGTPDKEV